MFYLLTSHIVYINLCEERHNWKKYISLQLYHQDSIEIQQWLDESGFHFPKREFDATFVLSIISGTKERIMLLLSSPLSDGQRKNNGTFVIAFNTWVKKTQQEEQGFKLQYFSAIGCISSNYWLKMISLSRKRERTIV